MGIDYSRLALPKGEPTRRRRSRRRRENTAARQAAREHAEERDGYCRLAGVAWFGPCEHESQMAHFGRYRQARTRGQDPAERHRGDGVVMLCRRHHDLYDGRRRCQGHTLEAEALSDLGADGPLRWRLGDIAWEELAA